MIPSSEHFNLHFIDWEERGTHCGCRLRYEIVDKRLADKTEQMKRVIKLCETFTLVQVKNVPRRESDTLHLLFANSITFHKR